ncbi:MAG: 16S rRNA processing protein RimM [Proteobacteria bacterium]|nr:16S rRNA processing protein RimM [Pseudomonadota bacterium]
MVFFCGHWMSEKSEQIRVGVIGRAHGVQGEVRVCTENDSLLKVKKVYLGEDRVAYEVKRASRGGRFITLELAGVSDRDRAGELTGQEIWIDRSGLKPLRGAFYVCELVGSSIVDETGHVWGVVNAVMPSGAHDLLRYVRPDGGTGLVPFVKAHVGKIDREAKTITVESSWMAELDAIYGE